MRIDAKKPKKSMLTVNQGREYSLQRGPNLLQQGYLKSKDQVYNPRVLAAAKTCCLDILEHETLGYKKGHSSHFEARRDRGRLELNFRERNQFP